MTFVNKCTFICIHLRSFFAYFYLHYFLAFEPVRHSMKYPCCSNPYVIVTYNLSLHRRGKFYIFNLILPGGLIALLSCFSFFLPPLTGERTGLIITNFLSLSVYVLIVSDSVPPSSDTVPLLVK